MSVPETASIATMSQVIQTIDITALGYASAPKAWVQPVGTWAYAYVQAVSATSVTIVWCNPATWSATGKGTLYTQRA